jgi:predicted  nucleic acid-binding Zn-ribbon protein
MAEATQTAQAPVVEEVKNCPACKKPLKKARRFYRNGAYYCNNNCFKKVQAETKAKSAEAEADAAKEAKAVAEADAAKAAAAAVAEKPENPQA